MAAPTHNFFPSGSGSCFFFQTAPAPQPWAKVGIKSLQKILQKHFLFVTYARGVLDLNQHVLEVGAARVVGYAVVVKVPENK